MSGLYHAVNVLHGQPLEAQLTGLETYGTKEKDVTMQKMNDFIMIRIDKDIKQAYKLAVMNMYRTTISVHIRNVIDDTIKAGSNPLNSIVARRNKRASMKIQQK